MYEPFYHYCALKIRSYRRLNLTRRDIVLLGYGIDFFVLFTGGWWTGD